MVSLVIGVGTQRVWIALALLLVVLPYNGFFDWWMRKSGSLHWALAYTDHAFAVAFLAIDATLLPVVLLFMLAITANTAIAFGRLVAMQSTALGFVGSCIVLAIAPPPNALPAIVTYAVVAAFTSYTVGSMAEGERELRERYADLMSGIDAIVWEQLTAHPSTLYVNEEAEKVLGYPAAAWAEPGMWSNTVHPDDRREVRRLYRDAIRRGQSRELEYRMVTADGREVWVQDRMRIQSDSLGRPIRVRGVMVDVTATKSAQQQASQFVDIVNGIKLALFVFGLEDPNDDETLTVRALNPEAAHLVDVATQDAVGRTFDQVLTLPNPELLMGSLADVIRTGEGFTIDEIRTGKGGRGGRVYSAFAYPLPGEAVGLSLHDITDRTMAAEVLRRQALHDGLTGLPNRTLLHERVRSAIAAASRDGSTVALLVMDIDQFKEVNDALGHDQGDRLLIEMSRRLQRVLRDANTIARLGGDEFAVLVTGLTPPKGDEEDGAVAVARAIRTALEQPFLLGGISLQTNASIGIATFPEHADTAEILSQRADVAMYAAKRTGSGVTVYAAEHDQSSVHRLALLGELRGAISDGELVLHYQPSLDLDTGEVHSAEALVRWQHPTHGLMPPGEFIELAEVSGLIQPMTRWIIEAALIQIRAWLDVGIEVKVGVNLSVRNLYERDLVPWVSDLLIEHGVDARLLKLEVTESELMDDPLLALEVLGKLKALGATTSIDDFGTGYSSLAYLKHLPIYELKIDQSFVGNRVNDRSDLTIVRSTIDLSHNLGLSVVAEGVEDGETLRLLAELGCDRAQGYFVSRPVASAVFTDWVSAPAALDDVRSFLAPTDVR
jgi:diguanylate cyclase (GGDEF)-like protein/PAS domain S-box-containing protein